MKIMIAIPCMDFVATPFMKSLLGLQYEPGNTYHYKVCESSLIYDARNQLCKAAIDEGFDRITWFDSDMTFEPDIITRLSARLDEGNDFVTGLYFSRREESFPLIYEKVYQAEAGRKVSTKSIPYRDYPKDSLFEVAGCGFGGCMMNVSMIEDMFRFGGPPFSPRMGFGEDLSFCLLARESGYEIYCDSSVKLGHVAHRIVTEKDYKPC